MPNIAVLGIGSNYEPEKHIKKAEEELQRSFPEIQFSEAAYTQPLHCTNPALFLNRVAKVRTSISQEEFKKKLKQIEYDLGRKQTDKIIEKICIDIDLLQWNDMVLKPSDIDRPDIVQGIRSLQKKPFPNNPV